MKSLHEMACNNADVLRIWGVCAIDIDSTEKQLSILLEIVKVWTKSRGHSIASMEIEKYKKKKLAGTRKKKSLRKELQRQTLIN